MPAPFNEKVTVISSNSTLVIHDLQYNHSKYLFSSVALAAIDFGAGFKLNCYDLRLRISITVNGTKR